MGPRQQPSEYLPPTIGEVNLTDGEVANFERFGPSPETTREVTERQMAKAVEASGTIVAPVLPAPVSQAQSDDDQAVVAGATPLVAGDDDLIEKEWVDRAKQIIASTKDDPHKRETEIKNLQIEYVKKRYGRVIGESNGATN